MRRVLTMFGMGRPMAAAVGSVLNMCGMGRRMAAAAVLCVCVRNKFGMGRPVAAAALRGPEYYNKYKVP